MMAFFDSFVCSVIHNGKPLREFSENGNRTVKIPYDSEYKLRLKAGNRRALVNVEIDGTDVLCGKQLILSQYGSIDLERFVDSLHGGRKFKFVPLSNSGVQDPTNRDNGKIKVTFHPELPFSVSTFINTNHTPIDTTVYGARGLSGSSAGVTETAFYSAACASNGATVEGGESLQQFSQGTGFLTDTPIVMEIWMRGAAHEEVTNPRYVVRIQDGNVPQLWLERPFRAVQNAQIQMIDGGLMKFKIGPTEFSTKDFVVKYE